MKEMREETRLFGPEAIKALKRRAAIPMSSLHAEYMNQIFSLIPA